MKLLVTGGAGFIGSNFIRYWLASHPEDTIVNIDALTYAGNPATLAGFPAERHTHIHGSIADADVVRRAMDDVEMVVNFAAESHVDRSIIDSKPFVTTNVIGTHTLLEEMRRRGQQIKRFHHISTDEVFGALALDGDDAFSERTPYNPRNPYSATKAASDHLCRAYVETYGLPITISNCSNNYGPYMYPEKFFPKIITNALRDIPVPIYGDGMHVRHWIHVLDHCRAIEAILQRGTIGQTYLLGGSTELPNLHALQHILNVLGKPHSLITFVEDRKGHDRRYSIDDSRSRAALNWEPTISLEDGLADMVKWYVDHEAWWKPLLTD